jgi:hypothetical protein
VVRPDLKNDQASSYNMRVVGAVLAPPPLVKSG